MHIKKGDSVIVLTGKDKGKKGSVIKAMPDKGKVVIEGVNIMKRHQKARKANSKGEIISVTMPIDASNVALAQEKKEKKEKKTVKKK